MAPGVHLCINEVYKRVIVRNYGMSLTVMMFWLLQYRNDGTDNRQRLAVIHGSDLKAGMTGTDWYYYDFNAADFGIAGNRWLTVNPSTDWCGYTDVAVRVTDPGGLWDEDTFRVAVNWFCIGPLP